MIDHDNLEDFRDPQIYDLQDEGRCLTWHVELAAWLFAWRNLATR